MAPVLRHRAVIPLPKTCVPMFTCTFTELFPVAWPSVGSNNQKVKEAKHDQNLMHGKGSAYARNDIERLFRQLVVTGILSEELYVTPQDHTVIYLKTGKHSRSVLEGRMKVSSLKHKRPLL